MVKAALTRVKVALIFSVKSGQLFTPPIINSPIHNKQLTTS